MVRFGVVKQLTILGSTGSIGRSTLAIVDACPDEFSVTALVAGSNWKILSEQALAYRPSIVGIADENSLDSLRAALAGSSIEIVAGEGPCAAIAAIPVDVVVAGIVGLAGLPAVLAAVEAGQTVALANKESLVSAGGLVTSLAQHNGARLIPVDSEHSAIFQCWMGWAHIGSQISKRNSAICDAIDPSSIRHICLTASGGPFRDTPLEDFDRITPVAAVKHPNWSMGPKISIDSATMMNKGLEVIEAAWLFDLPSSSIDVLVHPQVAIHGMVYFNDGSVIAQLGTADMKTPISYALAWPGRLDWRPEPLDLSALGTLTFQEVDSTRYPCFALARQALESGGGMPTILNAANEVAVDAFLKTRIDFMDIADIVAHSLEKTKEIHIDSIEAVMRLDCMARQTAELACAVAASR
ncbi:MAG: 1-deoxy-D-xylulose-5-phosphate reductoisomerase [Rhodospirillaceae bacterium]|nr:1-deoxy-D-xylulose-5-phosphate reductoisomerase [Rhodospirillaceae bacterium]|tara:strand:- start:1799 stop:3031 length:1233 start_codon:yes stop_codon:yes gene_type:complete